MSEEKIFGSFVDSHSEQLEVFVCLFWISYGRFREDLQNELEKDSVMIHFWLKATSFDTYGGKIKLTLFMSAMV